MTNYGPGESTLVVMLPSCDVCRHEGRGDVPAYADGKTTMGPWANMCRDDFDLMGVGLGTGRGQVLLVREPAEASSRLDWLEDADATRRQHEAEDEACRINMRTME